VYKTWWSRWTRKVSETAPTRELAKWNVQKAFHWKTSLVWIENTSKAAWD